MYIVNTSYDKLRLRNINKVMLDKNIVNVKQTKLNFSDKFLPLSTNEIYYGKLLEFDTDSTGNYVSSLLIKDIDFVSIIKKAYQEESKPFLPLSSKMRFYHYIHKRNHLQQYRPVYARHPRSHGVSRATTQRSES